MVYMTMRNVCSATLEKRDAIGLVFDHKDDLLWDQVDLCVLCLYVDQLG